MYVLAPYTGKDAAGVQVNAAKKAGLLPYAKDCICVDCGARARDYDHRDYNKPLEVDPVCRRCNLQRGPAIPLAGAFRETVRRGGCPYHKTSSVARIFESMGVTADVLVGMPTKLTLQHWQLIVPEFERAYAAYAAYANRSI